MKFLKSTFGKCLTVLLIISIISGGILAVLNSLLFVSAEERTNRAVKKIYGEQKEISQIIIDIDNDDKQINSPSTNKYGTINKHYIIQGNYDGEFDILIQSTGIEGYHNGTITVWVKITHNADGSENIDKVLLETYEKQTLMSKLGDSFYNGFTLKDVTEEYKQGKRFTANAKNSQDFYNVVTGATMSSNAGCNAVNAVIEYVWGGIL